MERLSLGSIELIRSIDSSERGDSKIPREKILLNT
jgi:hypothetical protein